MESEIENQHRLCVGGNESKTDTICLCCNGYVINLSTQSSLLPTLADGDKDKSDDYTPDASILREINDKLPPREFNQREVAEWYKRGPLGRIHNTSVYYCRFELPN